MSQEDLFTRGAPPRSRRPLLFDRGGFDLVAHLAEMAIALGHDGVELGRDAGGLMQLTWEQT